MWKLFDKDFFKLLIGFLFILIASFGVFYLLALVSDQAGEGGRAEAVTLQ